MPFRVLSRTLEVPGREVRQTLRRRQEGFPDLGQRGRRQAVLDRQDGHDQRARPLPLPRVHPRERRGEPIEAILPYSKDLEIR